jgi:hypothetical protein
MLGLVKNRAQIKDLKEIINFIEAHLSELLTKEKSIPYDVFQVTVFLLKENIEIYQSISTLYAGDHFRSCLILARSILENSINLRFIYKTDSEQRALNYRAFSMKEYIARANKVKDITPEAIEFLDELKKLTVDYKPTGKRPGDWDGTSLRDRAVELHSESTYDVYRHLSNYMHSKFQGNRDLSVDRPYTNHLRRVVFKDILLFTLQALQAICEKYDLDGGIMFIDNYPKTKSTVAYATNPKRREEDMKRMRNN